MSCRLAGAIDIPSNCRHLQVSPILAIKLIAHSSCPVPLPCPVSLSPTQPRSVPSPSTLVTTSLTPTPLVLPHPLPPGPTLYPPLSLCCDIAILCSTDSEIPEPRMFWEDIINAFKLKTFVSPSHVSTLVLVHHVCYALIPSSHSLLLLCLSSPSYHPLTLCYYCIYPRPHTILSLSAATISVLVWDGQFLTLLPCFSRQTRVTSSRQGTCWRLSTRPGQVKSAWPQSGGS